jgi:hypothetical protein
LKKAAEIAGTEANVHGEVLTFGPVRLICTILWPKGRRVCDFQAAVHALKPLVDGLEVAGWFANDRQVVAMDVFQDRDRNGEGCVVVGMEEVTI